MTDPNEAISYIIKNSAAHAQAKGNRVYIEQYRKTVKAQLMAQSTAKTVSERETDAYGHAEYAALLDGLKEAVIQEEKLKFLLIAAQLRVDVWRTNQANNRKQDNATR
jgi:hypothetical protein